MGKRQRFCDEVLAAAESDFEPAKTSAGFSGAGVPISSASRGSRFSISSA
jgi:hypothetical protein